MDPIETFPELLLSFLELFTRVGDEGQNGPPREVVVQGVEESQLRGIVNLRTEKCEENF